MVNHFQDNINFVLQLLSGYRFQHEVTISNFRKNDISLYLNIKSPLDILDLANGQLLPQSYLLKSMQHNVFGIDLINNPLTKNHNIGYLGAKWLFNRRVKLTHDQISAIKLICGDVGKVPLANNCFDMITSVAAFEHFLDIPSVLEDCARILRKGGILWVLIHLFSSPSGGHNVKLMDIPLKSLPRGVDAWDHLRKRELPFHVPLNEWRIHRYLEEFSHHFDIVKHYCAMREGENLLTPEIEAELSDYTRDELTCSAYIIVAKKI